MKTIIQFLTEVVYSRLWKGVCLNIMYPIVEPPLTEVQHGFMKHKSCTTQFLYMQLLIFQLLIIMTNIIQRVVLNGHTSTWLPVLSGLPRGTILGPLLIILFINDMPLSCVSSKTRLFADFAKIYMKIEHILDCTLLQADLNRLYSTYINLLTTSRAEYSTPVWCLQNPNELPHLESIQRGKTLFVTKFDGRIYQDRCN